MMLKFIFYVNARSKKRHSGRRVHRQYGMQIASDSRFRAYCDCVLLTTAMRKVYKSTNLLYSSVMHRMNTLPSSLSRVTVVPSIRQVLTLGARFSEALRRRSEFYILMGESLGQAPSNISQ